MNNLEPVALATADVSPQENTAFAEDRLKSDGQ